MRVVVNMAANKASACLLYHLSSSNTWPFKRDVSLVMSDTAIYPKHKAENIRSKLLPLKLFNVSVKFDRQGWDGDWVREEYGNSGGGKLTLVVDWY